MVFMLLCISGIVDCVLPHDSVTKPAWQKKPYRWNGCSHMRTLRVGFLGYSEKAS